MKKAKSGSKSSRSSRLSSRQDSLTPRHQSISSLLSPKTPKRKKNEKKVEDKLISNFLVLRSSKAEKRLISKSDKLKEVREAPSIFPGSSKIFRAKSQSEIEAIVNTIEHSVKPKRRHTQKKSSSDLKRPQDVIPRPDIESIKEVLTRVTPKQANEKIDTKGMNIIQKTKILVKMKSEKIAQNREVQIKQEMKECTFKPNIEKLKTVKTLHKKSNSESQLNLKSPKDKDSDQDEFSNYYLSKQVRTPAPNKFHKRNPTLQIKGTFISSTLGKLSPGKVPGKDEISAKMNRLSMKGV
jgi:hypothetical protein